MDSLVWQNPLMSGQLVKWELLVAGGKEAFRMRPLFSTTTDPISPLTHTKDACDSLIEACKWGLPSKVNPISLPGGTSCVNIASTMINVNAEILSMFVLGHYVIPVILLFMVALPVLWT